MESMIKSRSSFADRAGMQFGGRRNINKAAGYVDEVNYHNSKERYERQDIAAAIIESYPTSTWKEEPIIHSDDDDFKEELQKLFDANAQIPLDRSVLHYFKRADILARLGKYAGLFIGWSDAADKSDLENEVDPTAIDSLDDVMYLTPIPEPNMKIGDKETNPGDERFGKPKRYQIDFDHVNGKTPVHWSRVIHIAEGVVEDPLEGRHALERVMNRLFDIEKTLAAAAEGAWIGAYPGLQLDIDKDLHGMVDTADLETQIEEYKNEMRRVIKTWGTDVNELEGRVINPANIVDTNVNMMAGALEIPKRKLIGSERGDLASTQDEASWYEKVKERQQSYAEPVIFRPFVDRLGKYGALTVPKSYEVEWPNLFELNDLEKAELKLQIARAIKEGAPMGDTAAVVTPEEFRAKVLEWDPERGSEVSDEVVTDLMDEMEGQFEDEPFDLVADGGN